jgi:hypothetical protein
MSGLRQSPSCCLSLITPTLSDLSKSDTSLGCDLAGTCRPGSASLLTPCSHRASRCSSVRSTQRTYFPCAHGGMCSSRLSSRSNDRCVPLTPLCRKQEHFQKNSAVEDLQRGLVAVFLSRSSSLVSSNSAGIHVPLYLLQAVDSRRIQRFGGRGRA